MKQLLTVLILAISITALADDVTPESISGKWKVVPDTPEDASMGEDHWVFESGKYQVMSSGRNIGIADPFRIEGSKIIYGTKPWEATITVLSLSNDKMQVDTIGIIQNLEKVETEK